MSDVCYKSHPFGTSAGQVWVRACGLSSSRGGNEQPEGHIKRAPPHCSPALPLSAHRCSLGPSLPTAPDLCHPVKPQGKAGILKSCDCWWGGSPPPHPLLPLSLLPSLHTTAPTFYSGLLISLLSLLLHYSAFHLFASSFSPLSSPCSLCRRKTASHAIQPCKPWLMAQRRKRREGSFNTQHLNFKSLLFLWSVLLEELWGLLFLSHLPDWSRGHS